MTQQFRLSFVIDADGKPAQAALDQTSGAAQKAAGTMTGLGKGAAAADAEIAGLRAEVAAFRAQIETLSATEARAAAQITALTNQVNTLEAALGKRGGGGRSGGSGAAGAMGVLIANFNDLGVMMAAGQNPLQLALQQGTQITQVIGPMGAAGAARALGSAFLGMLSPINLVTIGAIALGGTLVNWLTSASDEARSFDETLQDLEKTTKNLAEITDIYSAQGITQLKEKYGEVTAAVLSLIEAQRQQALTAAQGDASAAISGLVEEYRLVGIEAGDTGRLVEQRLTIMANALGIGKDAARELAVAIRDAGTAATFEAQAAALTQVRELLAESGAEGGDLYQQLLNAEDQMRQLAASVPQANWLAAAVSGAKDLASALWDAATARAAATDDAAGNPSAFPEGSRARRAPPRAPNGLAGVDWGTAPKSSGGGGGSRKAEAESVADLVKKLQLELAVLKEIDPVQQELLRHRETLAKATSAEKKQVEDLVRQQIEEKQHLADLKAASEDWRQTLDGDFASLLTRAKSFDDVLAGILMKFAEMAATSLFDDIWEAGGSDFVDVVMAAMGFADGGKVVGPGTGRSDSILARVSNGEFIMNAKATAEHLPLLEAMNSGRRLALPAFADGGYVGPSFLAASGQSAASLSGGQDRSPLVIELRASREFDAKIERAAEDVSVRTVRAGLTEFDRQVLPGRVQQIRSDGRVRG